MYVYMLHDDIDAFVLLSPTKADDVMFVYSYDWFFVQSILVAHYNAYWEISHLHTYTKTVKFGC